MRRIARTLVPALLAVALTAGCGGGGDSGSETTSSGESPSSDASGAVPERGDADLVIWTDALKIDAVKKVADEFAAAKGIKVATQAISSDLQTNFVTANTAGNGPDVVVGAHDWIGNLVQNGAIDPLPLTPDQLRLLREGRPGDDVRRPAVRRPLRHRGARPLPQHRGGARRARQDIDEAIKAGEAARKAGKVDSALNLPVGENGDAYHMEPVLTSMGGYLFGQTADGEYDPSDLGVGKPGSLDAAETISELGRRAEGAAHLDQRRTTRSPSSPAARPRSWSPARGRSRTSRRAASTTRSSRSPASPASSPRSRSWGRRRSWWPRTRRTSRSPRSSSPTA